MICCCSAVCQGLCHELIPRVGVTLFSTIGGPTMVGSGATERFLIRALSTDTYPGVTCEEIVNCLSADLGKSTMKITLEMTFKLSRFVDNN